MHSSNAWHGTEYFVTVFSTHNNSRGRNYCLNYQNKESQMQGGEDNHHCQNLQSS